MGIRRRRKKLTSLLSNMDRRIRTVEFKKTAVAGGTTLEATSAEEEANPNEPEGSVYSGNIPNPWTRVKRAYFHPSNVVSGDRFEVLYYSTEGIEGTSGSSVEKGDLVSISSLARTAAPIVTVGRTYFKSDSTSINYTCRAHGTPSWTYGTNTRETLKFKGNQVYVPLPISGDTFGTVTHTYLFSQGTSLTGTSARYSLATRALIASHVATTTTATLTVSGTHHYQVNDLIDVKDLPTEYHGLDGIFKVSAVTSSTISFTFDTELESAIASATASSGVYVYSVAQKYVRVGSTWFDSANNNRAYFWNGLRYQVGQVAGLSNDGSAPSPPTNLQITSTGYARPDGSSRSRVDLSWTAPTTSANGSALDDLLGYKLRISETGYSQWRDTRDLAGPTTSETVTNLDPDKEYFFRVTAYDSFGNESTGLDGSTVTGVAALTVERPSAPIIGTVRLGVVPVSWNGKDYNGATVPQAMIKFIEVHASTTSGFTPSSSTLKGKIYKSNDPLQVTGLDYNVTYYFKFVSIDTSDNATAASDQTSTQIKPLVDTDLIAAQLNAPLTAWPFANGAVTAGALASGAINASNMFSNGVIVQAAVAADAIGANQIAANAITAGKISSGAVTAGKIDALAISAGNIQSNAITSDKIEAGAVVASKVSAGAIDASKLLVTDTFIYRNPSDTLSVQIGYDAVDQRPGNPGLSLNTGSGSGSTVGWVGYWAGGSAVEIATSFLNNYIDIFTDNTMHINSSSTLNIDGGSSLNIYAYNNLNLTSNLGAVFAIGQFRNQYAYDTTTTTVPNLTISSAGLLRRTTHANSSRAIKTDIEPLQIDLASYLSLTPVLYKYKAEVESGKLNPTVFSGFIAEDLDERGFRDLVQYDKDGKPEAIRYDRLTGYLHLVLQDQERRIQELERTINP